MTSLIDDACTWASEAQPAVLLILGHWNLEGDGCDINSTVPSFHTALKKNPLCASVASRMKYFEGHKHCNIVVEPDIGFMVNALYASFLSFQWL